VVASREPFTAICQDEWLIRIEDEEGEEVREMM
jgi:hypothetical protein